MNKSCRSIVLFHLINYNFFFVYSREAIDMAPWILDAQIHFYQLFNVLKIIFKRLSMFIQEYWRITIKMLMAGSIISKASDCKPVATKETPPEFPQYLHRSQSVILKGYEFYVGQELLACQDSWVFMSPATMLQYFLKKKQNTHTQGLLTFVVALRLLIWIFS